MTQISETTELITLCVEFGMQVMCLLSLLIRLGGNDKVAA
jgi:hypothetical protein